MGCDKKDKIVTGARFGLKLLEAMGIDPNRVVSFTINCDPRDGVTVDVKRFVTTTAADGLLEGLNGSIVTERFNVNKQEGE